VKKISRQSCELVSYKGIQRPPLIPFPWGPISLVAQGPSST